MLTETRTYDATLDDVEDILKAVKDPDLSEHFDEKLSLVGVSLESITTINPDILSDTQIKNIRRGVDNRLELTITLKPGPNEENRLFTLDAVLARTEYGYVEGLGETPDNTEAGSLARYFDSNTILSDIHDYDVHLYFYPEEENVVYRDFKIMGIGYKQLTLTLEPVIDGEPFKIELHLLVKAEEGIETFFSAFTKDDLTRSTTLKLLKTVCDRNITGLFIGSVYYADKSVRMTSQAYSSIEGKYVEKDGKATFDFYTSDTYISLDESKIKGSIVVPTQSNKYTFKLYLTGGGSLSIQLG